MLFNSYEFIFGFLPITLLIFFTLGKWGFCRGAIAFLAIASLFFYAYWNPVYLWLLLISITVNYVIGSQIHRLFENKKQARRWLIVGIIFNLGILGYYKYTNFFLSSIENIAFFDFPVVNVVLPLAISFYTFTQIAYLVDTYRGYTQESNYDFLTYALFVTFFPQLIAGPILRHNELIPQFKKKEIFEFCSRNFSFGITLFILGLSKKVLIADNISSWVAPVFSNASDLNILEAWVGTLSYTFQLYFDFSGYSDMAIGLGWMFNVSLPINFNSPYKATSISDFWRRWHITLSHFLRDYLYIPLGGNRQGELRCYGNLFITMLLGGLWHGAGWTFVIWGGLHGFYLVVNRIWHRWGIAFPKLVAWMLSFLAIVVGWVFFRSSSLSDSVDILQTMFGMKGFILPTSYQKWLGWLEPMGLQFQGWQNFSKLPDIGGNKCIAILGILTIGVAILPNTQEILRKFQPSWMSAIVVSTLAVLCLLSMNRISEFLYFQF